MAKLVKLVAAKLALYGAMSYLRQRLIPHSDRWRRFGAFT